MAFGIIRDYDITTRDFAKVINIDPLRVDNYLDRVISYEMRKDYKLAT